MSDILKQIGEARWLGVQRPRERVQDTFSEQKPPGPLGFGHSFDLFITETDDTDLRQAASQTVVYEQTYEARRLREEPTEMLQYSA